MTLWAKTRRKMIAIALLAAWLGGVAFTYSVLSANPLNEPVTLDPPGLIETEVWLRVPERYDLEFAFSRANRSFDELQELIGRWSPNTDGVPIEIAWSISNNHGMVVADGTTTAKGASGWANDIVYRSVASMQVPPGRYYFRAQILEPVPQLARLSPRLLLGFNFKNMTSSQMTVLFWLSIVNTIVGLPVLLALVVYLVVVVIRHLTSGPSGPASLRSDGR